jgi:hypothetical protein
MSVTASPETERFPHEVCERLKYYVYRLIDPRNGETFYVGKGKDNRVFAHIKGDIKSEDDEPDPKLKRIWEIQGAGFEVAHVIHRHGMDEDMAVEVEAALIDAYAGLTNVAGGEGSSDFGVMHAREIIAKYRAEPADFKHRAILVNVNRRAGDVSLYDAVRFAWKVGKKAEDAELVLAVKQGLIVGAFVPTKWLPATSENFPEFGESPGRVGFVGIEASAQLKAQYVNKRLPDEYRKKGAANPIKYTWTINNPKPAKAKDWNALPMPEKQKAVSLDRTFSQQDVALIRLGVVPQQMEDKWFIYWKNDTLCFHRSWTGFCIYAVRFRQVGDQWRMTEANLNRDREQYEENRDSRDVAMISYLIDVLLLRQASEFPADENVGSEMQPVSQWSTVGRAMFEGNSEEENAGGNSTSVPPASNH